MAWPPTVHGPAAYQKLRFLTSPIGLLESCARRHGDAFRLLLGRPGLFVFSRPDHVKAIYTADTEVLRAGEAKRAIFGRLLGGASSLLLDGEPHLRRRKLLLPQFKGERMAMYASRIAAETRAAIARMPVGQPFALLPIVQSLTLRVMLSALLGPEDASSAPLWRAMERFATDAASSRLLMAPALQWDLGPYSPWGRVQRVVRAANGAVESEIQRRRARPNEGRDLLDLLLSSSDEHGASLTDAEVKDEVLTLVVAGHEITSMVLTWLVHAVISRPEVQARIDGELEAIGEHDVGGLTYLDSVVRESMRFHSVVPIGSARLATEDTRIGEHDVPRGAMVNVAIHLLHRRPEIFERPDEFRPERFSVEPRVGPYEWAPFGGGARRCLGMSFALFELKLITATLFSRVALVGLERPRAVRRGAFVAPSGGLRVVVKRLRAARPGSSERRAA
jgi:cytochrome P450 family 110